MNIAELAKQIEIIEKLAELLPANQRETFTELARMKIENYQKLNEALMTKLKEDQDEQ